MNEHLTFNQRLSLAGVETIRVNNDVVNGVNLKYGDKVVPRPPVNTIEDYCLRHFGINI